MLVLAVLGVGGWTAVQVWLVAGDLRSARDAASDVARGLKAGETQGLRQQVDSLREHARGAADRTDTVTWRGLSALPVVGDDAEAVSRLARAVDVIAEESVVPLLDVGLDPARFTPRRGRIPLAPIDAAAPALARAAAGFDDALHELVLVERDGLLDAVRDGYDSALVEVSRGHLAAGAAASGADLLPDMLGAREERTYLVIFQNSAEVRSLGGMPGMVATLTAHRGRLTLGETVPVGSFGLRGKPVLPLTDEERKIWFDQPGTYFQDAVFIPDFPRASELMVARFADETGQQVDGVLSVDPAAMSYVVGASGGLTVDGVALTQANFVDELVHKTYLRYPDDREAENAFFAAVATSVFDDALGGGVGPERLIEALARGVEEGRVLLHSSRDAEQEQLTGTRIAGELPVDAQGPMQVGIYANDSTGSKMSYFLRHDADVDVQSCAGGTAQLRGRLVVHSDTPGGVASLPEPITGSGVHGVPRGVQLDTFTIVGPVGGEIADVEIDGEPTQEDLATYRGRPVAKIPVWLEPRARVEVTWRMAGRIGAVPGLELLTTPQVKAGGGVVSSTLSCEGADVARVTSSGIGRSFN